MTKEFEVQEENHGRRIDAFLAAEIRSVSRSQIQRLIKEGSVMIDGRRVTPATRLEGGNRISVDGGALKSLEAPVSVLPERGQPLEILHEDEAVIVVYKPAGLLMHPTSARKDEATLADSLVAHFPEMIDVGESSERPGIMHRLDKDASGLIVAAKTPKAYAGLKRQFQEREVKKEYLTLVHGAPPQDEGTISMAIGRKKHSGIMTARPEAREGDREAVTHYEILERFPNMTLLSVRTETGRTHQIRVHLKAIGCPVAGDDLYGPDKTGGKRAPRLFLHAHKLAFRHPISGKRLDFTKDLPADLQQVLDDLRGA